mmetsp:Transcript_30374/g.97140  ORF Transcript_30374/g.97140 Transcript_30374/m.97140 type:complete len:238 (+) Transcript_30374:164-877(+)
MSKPDVLPGVRLAGHDQARGERLLHVLMHSLGLVHAELDGFETGAVPTACEPISAVRCLLQNPDVTVRGVPDLLELLHCPAEVAHAEDADEEAVRHEYEVLNGALSLAPGWCVHEAVERGPEVTHAVIDVSASLTTGEAEVEAPELLPLGVDLLHLLGVLEVAEVLLAEPGLRGDLHRPALEGLEDGHERLSCAQVGGEEEASVLIAYELPDPLARGRALLEAARRQRDLGVRLLTV